MANQPPVRPWFRLASLRPLPAAPAPAPPPPPPPAPEAQPPAPAPAPPPAPVTRPIMSLPTFRTSSAPSSPQTRTTQPPAPAPLPAPAPEPIAPRPAERASVPSSPARKVPSPPAVQKAAVSVPSSLASDKTSPNNNMTQSPKTIRPAVQAPMESPKVRPSAAPPSPLVLPPPSQPEAPRIPAEAEPKTVVMQKTIEKPKQRSNGVGDEKGKMSHQEKSLKEGKKTEGGGGFRVITIAGENRGAFMEVIQSAQKGQKKSMAKEDSEEGEAKKKKNGRGRSTASFPMTAFVNSNVQSVNNSLLYNASCSHHDPGVRFCLSKKPVGDEQSN